MNSLLPVAVWLVKNNPQGDADKTNNTTDPPTAAAPDAESVSSQEPTSGWDQIIEFISQRGAEFGLNLVAAIAIFVIGRWVAKLLTSMARRMAVRANVDATLVKFLTNLVYIGLMVFVILAALRRLGVDTTSFAAVMAAAGLAIGLALQGSLANFASGVMMILFKPFKVGDFVEAGGSSGTIEEIQIFQTVLRTGDNVRIIVPNSAITSSTITNYSANETRRVDLVVGCGYGDNLREVRAFLEDVLQSEPRILEDPEPVVAVSELGDSSVNFVVRPWVKREDYWSVKWDLTEAIKLGFDERGFNIPYPTQDIHVHQHGDES